MSRHMVYGLGVAILLVTTTTGSVWAQYGEGTDLSQTATPEQLEECKSLGIPEFTCTQGTILAKKRVTSAAATGAYGSGTSMITQTFGEMGAILGILAAIFGGVAVAFFAKSRVGKKAEA